MKHVLKRRSAHVAARRRSSTRKDKMGFPVPLHGVDREPGPVRDFVLDMLSSRRGARPRARRQPQGARRARPASRATAARSGACSASSCGSRRSTTASAQFKRLLTTRRRCSHEGADHRRRRLHRLAPRRPPARRAATRSLVIDNYATGRRDNLAEHERLDDRRGHDRRRGARRRGRSRASSPTSSSTPRPSYKDPDDWAEDARTNVARHGERRAGAAGAPASSGSSTSRRRSATGCTRSSSRSRSTTRSARRVELRDLQDGGRAVRRAQRARLGLVPAGERVRAAQHQRPAADVLPAPDERQAVLRDGHAARLHLRRRPDRRRRARRSTARARAAPYHVSSGSDYSIKELFDATVDGARASSSTTRSRCGRATRTTRSRSCSTRRRRSDDFGWTPTTPLEEGVAAAIEYYRDVRHRGDVHPPAGSSRDAARRSERARRRSVLVVGGAGFVGSNLVRELLDREARAGRSSSTTCSRPSARTSPTTRASSFVEGSIADDDVLGELDDEFDYVFHLATYHGNQSSIADPLADHENNLITTLKLYERLKDFGGCASVVYAASGCTLAEQTYDDAEATQEDGPVPLDLDSPYQISKVVGEFYSVYYHRARAADRARALPERLRPRRDPRRRALARHARDGLAQRHADVRLPGAEGPAARARQRRARDAATSSTSATSCDGLIALRRPRASRATSTTSRAASRRRSASSPS